MPEDEAYFIAKEILATERTYLKDLEVITVVWNLSPWSLWFPQYDLDINPEAPSWDMSLAVLRLTYVNSVDYARLTARCLSHARVLMSYKFSQS